MVLALAPVVRHRLLAKDSAETTVAVPPVATSDGSTSARPGRYRSGAEVPKPRPRDAKRLRAEFTNLPLAFEANEGQAGTGVDFVAHGPGYEILLAPGGARLEIPYGEAGPLNPATVALPAGSREVIGPANASKLSKPGWDELAMKLVGANAAARVSGQDALQAKTNYFIGNNPAHWRTNVPNFGKVRYSGVYSGIDLVYYG
ncbi:MAG: hypothetical protein ACRD3T_16325, partial [Terriglobia bacterium]